MSDKEIYKKEIYKFVRSYKNMFCYGQDGNFYIIAGDLYRDVFEPTMTQNKMDYFIELEGVEVYEGEL